MEEEGGKEGGLLAPMVRMPRGLRRGLATEQHPGMAPCSLLPDQDNEAGTQVGWVLVAPGDTPRGARPGALLLRGDLPPLEPQLAPCCPPGAVPGSWL